jgi:hypothetical protein
MIHIYKNKDGKCEENDYFCDSMKGKENIGYYLENSRSS